MAVTKQEQKLIDSAVEIMTHPMDVEAAFMARALVQVTLPHSNPGNIPVWGRTNGNLSLSVQPNFSIDPKTGETISSGIPYGTIPRLLLFWITTEAVKTKSRRIELGDNLSTFMSELGLTPTGGRWGSITRLKEQVNRLFQAKISLEYSNEGGKKWRNMEIASGGELWWNYKEPENPTIFKSWIELGEKFYDAIISAPVPVDMRALRALKRSPLALDLYAWSTYKTFVVTQKGKAQEVPWAALEKQLGTNYGDLSNFRKKSKAALKKIQSIYPGLKLEFIDGGVKIKPGRSAVPYQKKRV